MAEGRTPAALLEEVPVASDSQLDPQRIAHLLFTAVLLPDSHPPSDWPEFWPAWQPHIHQFLLALEQRSYTPGLTRRTTTELERIVLDHLGSFENAVVGSTAGVRIEITRPIERLVFPEGIERAYCKIEMEGERLGAIELPVFGGSIPRYVLKDAIAAECAWIILGRFFEHTVYSDLVHKSDTTGVSLLRGKMVLAAGLPESEPGFWQRAHNQIGWLVFLQEIWARPGWDNRRFYEDIGIHKRAKRRQIEKGELWLEISEPLDDIETPGERLQVTYALGGAVIGRFILPVKRRLVRAAQLRIAINYAAGYELCRVAIREGLLGKPLSEAISLHNRLEAAAKDAQGRPPVYGFEHSAGMGDNQSPNSSHETRIFADVSAELAAGKTSLLIGRRHPGFPGTSHSRRAVLPPAGGYCLIRCCQSCWRDDLNGSSRKARTRPNPLHT